MRRRKEKTEHEKNKNISRSECLLKSYNYYESELIIMKSTTIINTVKESEVKNRA